MSLSTGYFGLPGASALPLIRPILYGRSSRAVWEGLFSLSTDRSWRSFAIVRFNSTPRRLRCVQRQTFSQPIPLRALHPTIGDRLSVGVPRRA